MAFNYENFVKLIQECQKTTDMAPLLIVLKTCLECKEAIVFEMNNYYEQLYCQLMTNALSRQCCGDGDNTEVVAIVCEALVQQAPFSNVRWFLMDNCHILDCLAKQFLSSLSNQSIQIIVAKTMQTFLIHSEDDENKSSMNKDLVSKLFQQLVDILQGSYSQEYSEASLGLLASLCQIWAGYQEIMNIIEDYQVLRKQLLRFLSAEVVKRTTIVYTMTIMFHLCNSDDRLFNKRNIRQTLQVLFNIMLNGDIAWASLYAVRLLMEICKSMRTCHLLTEYRSLPVSLKDTILQISGKEKLVIEKHLEFILIISRVNPEYRQIVMNIMIPEDNTMDNSWSQNEPICILINLINDPNNTISTYSIRLLDEVYVELISMGDKTKLPHISRLGEAILQSLSSIVSKISKTDPQNVGDHNKDATVKEIGQKILSRNNLSHLTKVKCVIQLMTNLLMSGDQWFEHVAIFMNHTNQIIKEQIDSNPLNNNISLLDDALSLDCASLGVEIFIDVLYFYYKATEIRPSSSMFGERLKCYLEESKCPIMLAFALSAATHNQTVLQRALVLQGVCLHLQHFNVDLMGQKMFQFSSEFASVKCQAALSKKHPTTKSQRDAEAVDIVFPDDSKYSPLSNKYNEEIFETYVGKHDLESTTTNMSQIFVTENLNPVDIESSKNNALRQTNIATKSFSETMNSNFSGDQMDKMNLDTKVQQIVKKWIDLPETKFSSNEIYSIFEHRIQSMQNQETLMEEILANKTAALQQNEALLNQYRNKLLTAEKESKQLRSIQVDTESRFDCVNRRCEQLQMRIIELEKMNQVLIDSNRNSDKHKEDCLNISKKLQERLLKVSDEKSKLQTSLETCLSQLEDFQKVISQKDMQIANYTQVTQLINKLTGNKVPATEINLPSGSKYDCYANSNNNNKEALNDNNRDDGSVSLNALCSGELGKRTVSITDFLRIYKNNSQFLHKNK